MKLTRLLSRIGLFLRGLSSEKLACPAPGKARSRTSLFIGLYLFWQIALPLSYYLGESGADERFAWRMFSAVNFLQKTCIVSLGEWRPGGDLRPLPKEEFIELVPPGWMQFLHRDRGAVITKFLSGHCQANPALIDVELLRKCAAPDRSGSILESLKMSCLTRVMRRAQESP